MLVGASIVAALAANAIQTDFVDEIVLSGLSSPTNVEFAPNGKIFVAEKGGRVKVFDSLSDPTPDIFIDLSANVHDYWDRGLLGLAIHPDFPSTPYIYVLYTYDAAIGGAPPTWGDACPNPPGATNDGCVVSGRLSRLTANGNQSIGGETVLIEDWCQQYPSHSIGDLEFGADGALYVTGGDGASFNWEDFGQGGGDPGSPVPANPCGDTPVAVGGTQTAPTAEGGALRSQDLLTAGDPVSLDGTLLRVNPITGAAMPDNPLIGNSDLNARRIVAFGLRNPFRMAIKPGTNEVYTGDVGWNTWEEVNRHPNPSQTVLNYGWPCYEGGNSGSLVQSGYQSEGLTMCANLYSSGAVNAPFFAYRHNQDITGSDACPPAAPGQGTSSSISGLDFYTGGDYPGSYIGALFGSDYSRDCIWVMLPDGSGNPDPSTVTVFQHQASNPVDVERGLNGDIFYVDLNGGTIRRLRFVGANTPPQAVMTAIPLSGQAPLDVDFDASGSSDADDDALSYAWDFDNDGQYDDATGVTASWTFAPGSHTVKLLATDARGETDTDSVVIQSSNGPPVPVIDTPSPSLLWKVGNQVSFSGHATDPDEGTLPASALDWVLKLHHCEDDGSCHVHGILSQGGVASGSFDTPDHEHPSWLELELTSTDQFGSSVSTSIQLNPQTVDLTFDTAPFGLDLVVGGVGATAPITETEIVGASLGIAAPGPQQTPDTNWWAFSSWSDGGSATHDIVTPNTDTTYTASFNRYPVISGPSTVDVLENTTFVTDIGTSDDTDTEGSGLVYTVSGGPDQGDFSIVGSTGVLSFAQSPDFESPADAGANNVYNVTVTVTDNGGLTDSLSMAVTVLDGNETPTADNDSYTTQEDAALNVATNNGVLDNDNDPEDDPLTAAVTTGPAHGVLVLNGNGSFSYTPAPNWNGVDQFTYQACDTGTLCDGASVTVTVDPINDVPSAGNDSYEIFQDTTLNRGAQVGVLKNDTDIDGDSLNASRTGGPSNGSVALSANGSFTYTPNPGWFGIDQFTYQACDPTPACDGATVSINVKRNEVLGAGDGHSFGLVDSTSGIWYLLDPDNLKTTSFYYGWPGDIPFVGDWDCDGDETPGLYRQSDGYVYLRNSNSQGFADLEFYFGIPGDIPIAGDFNGDGCDTVSIYRPSEGRVYIINHLGKGAAGLGNADFAYYFGIPFDKPFVGDVDDDGVDEVGLHRESTGLVYFRLTHTQGPAHVSFIYGIPDDRIIAGEWAWRGVPGPDSVGIYRPGDATFYLRFTNTPGFANLVYPYGNAEMYPVAGHFGDLPGGGPVPG
ncbi:MAG: Ig-like domain-containing protein [Acidimicrobiia bacterium]